MLTPGSPVTKQRALSELTKALQAVRNPATYVGTGADGFPLHRAALAERAKAMTGLMLFMTEGLIRARVRARDKGICDPASVVHNAWLRWLQLHGRQAHFVVPMDGWLVSAFPSELICHDGPLLDVLAGTQRLGEPSGLRTGASVPLEFLVPVTTCFSHDPALTVQLSNQSLVGLLSARTFASEAFDERLASMSAELERCASHLFVDLTSATDRSWPLAELAEYPGH